MKAAAAAKINLALIVGPRRAGGKHEVVTVLQRLDLADRIALDPAAELSVDGFAEDTLVERALRALAGATGVEPRWAARIEKRIPARAGLGGGSSDAATALRLANDTLDHPLTIDSLAALASGLGADVPFFLTRGPQLGQGDGSKLTSLDLPQDYWVVLCLPDGEVKHSTGAVYEAFDARGGEQGFDDRRATLLEALGRVRRPRDLAALPPNDVGSSPVSDDLRQLGAFRADVSGAGPAVYGLFSSERDARAAEQALRGRGRTWFSVPAWYG